MCGGIKAPQPPCQCHPAPCIQLPCPASLLVALPICLFRSACLRLSSYCRAGHGRPPFVAAKPRAVRNLACCRHVYNASAFNHCTAQLALLIPLAHGLHGLGRQAHAALAHPHVPSCHVALVHALSLQTEEWWLGWRQGLVTGMAGDSMLCKPTWPFTARGSQWSQQGMLAKDPPIGCWMLRVAIVASYKRSRQCEVQCSVCAPAPGETHRGRPGWP